MLNPKENNTAASLPFSPSRPSFREAISLAKKQVSAFAFDESDKGIVEEICMIIAEIYMMNPDKPIRISGEWLDGYIVSEVFREIDSEHVRFVINSYKRVSGAIQNVKAYLRTMLYNSVFSIDADATLKVAQQFGPNF